MQVLTCFLDSFLADVANQMHIFILSAPQPPPFTVHFNLAGFLNWLTNALT